LRIKFDSVQSFRDRNEPFILSGICLKYKLTLKVETVPLLSTNSAKKKKTGKQPSATKIAADKIKHLIFTGELVADSNHLETELAERLGISRTPVREATLTLQALGLLEVQPRKGIKIKAISIQDMSDIYEVLTELECLAVKRVATMQFSKADLKPIFDAIEQMTSALKNGDRESWAIADEVFHLTLVQLSGNSHLENSVRTMNDQVRRARAITLSLRPLPTKSNNDHRMLCKAILKGDANTAVEIHRRHRENAGKLLIDILHRSALKRL